MADISGSVWLVFGLIVGIASLALNYFTHSLRFTLFIVVAAIMIIYGSVRMLADRGYQKEKKRFEEEKRKMDVFDEQRYAQMQQEHQRRLSSYEQKKAMHIQAVQRGIPINTGSRQGIQGSSSHPSAPGIKYCPRCGQMIKSSDKFCFNCGSRI